MLHAHIMNHLIKAALEEGCIHRKIRLHTACCHAGSHGDRMFLCNAHIQHPIRQAFFHDAEPCTGRHSRRNGHNPRILFGHVGQFHRHNLAEGRKGSDFPHVPCFYIKGRCAVKGFRHFLCFVIAIAFLGQHVNHHRLIIILHKLQGMLQAFQIVPVNGAKVMKAQCTEETFVHKNGLDHILGSFGDAVDLRQLFQVLLYVLLGTRPAFADANIRQMPGQGTHIRCNGHFIVIQDHD